MVLYSLAMLLRVSPRLTLCTRCRLGLLALADEVFPLVVGTLPLAVVFEAAAACEGCAAPALAEVLEPLLAAVPGLALALPGRVEADVRCGAFRVADGSRAACLPTGL